MAALLAFSCAREDPAPSAAAEPSGRVVQPTEVSAKSSSAQADGGVPDAGVKPLVVPERDAADKAAAPRARGTITKIELEAGAIVLRTEQGERAVRATPAQLSWLSEATPINAPVASFGGQPWLMTKRGLASARLGRTLVVNGALQAVDRVGASLTVGFEGNSVTVRAHPADVVDVLPGQAIALVVHRVGDSYWATAVMAGGDVPLGVSAGP